MGISMALDYDSRWWDLGRVVGMVSEIWGRFFD